MHKQTNAMSPQVGRQYEAENEEELKDKLDFVTQREPSPLLGESRQ